MHEHERRTRSTISITLAGAPSTHHPTLVLTPVEHDIQAVCGFATMDRVPYLMKIAIDIDSTLHHYWDDLWSGRHAGASACGFPYAEQVTWEIAQLRPRQLRACIAETHADAIVLKSRALPGRGRGRHPAGTSRATGSTSPAIATADRA